METAESPAQSLPLIGGAQEEVKVISSFPPPPVEGATDTTDGDQVAPPGVGHLPDIGNEAMVTRIGDGLVKDTELSSEESEEGGLFYLILCVFLLVESNNKLLNTFENYIVRFKLGNTCRFIGIVFHI